MAEPLELLKELVHLAHERTDESRCKFLRQVTDVFMLTPERYTDLQRQCFGEIIEKVAYDLEWQMRKELARRISSENYAPRKLVQRLAHDVIPVAQPVLEQSPVLTEVDLVQVSENRSQDHLLSIVGSDYIHGCKLGTKGQNLSRFQRRGYLDWSRNTRCRLRRIEGGKRHETQERD